MSYNLLVINIVPDAQENWQAALSELELISVEHDMD